MILPNTRNTYLLLPTIALFRITLFNSIDNHVTKKLLEQLALRTVMLVKR